MEQVSELPTFQVFINHRAVDTRTPLANLIYRDLTSHGLHVFLDVESLCPGDKIVSQIERAISSASVHIALFSERYAESIWNLDELRLILKSSHEHMIIPVFWDVEPRDLRYIENGCYADAFRKHRSRGRVSKETMEEWRAALKQVAEISGYLLRSNESDYGTFLDNILEIVLKVVKGPESLQLETYQVFISHRGPDAKLTHASLIYHSLKHCGLRVFLDQKELRTGDTLSPAIEGAIRNASVHILIFSKNYAESQWCLEELRWIMKSVDERATSIVPMFCDVEPTELRRIEGGCYEPAFKKHEGRRKNTREWKEALKKAADISGFIVKTNKSDYGIYLEEIVRIVFTEVKRREPIEVARHPVGLDEAAKDFQNKIQYVRELKETKMVGIAGMGGLGKSTLAKHFYNAKRFDFTRSCFLLNVRGRGLQSLQEQLIRELLNHDSHIADTIQGKGILQRRLQGLRALIVLDDVDDIEQIDSLLDMDAVGCGSLILLTSRDRDLLRLSSPKALLYDVKPLNNQHAQELFCRHAFLLPVEPVQGFQDLVGEFVEICGGLPSSLQVLGRHLAANRDKTYWKLQLEKFSKRLPDKIINTLKVSYAALRKEEKEMFLDIGCFLAGEDKEKAVRVLEGLGYYDARDCLESLHQNCLVDYNYDIQSNDSINYKDERDPVLCRLIMHNQVKGLARHIAKEEFFEFGKHKPLRLSCSNDITEMFQFQDGSEPCLTRGIRIPKGQIPPQLTDCINIRGVRLFVVDHPMDLSSFAMSGPLIWLRMNSFPSIPIPSTVSLASLRVLEVHGPGDDLQKLYGFDELPSELRELNSGASGAASANASSSRQRFDVEHYMNFCRNIFSAQQGSGPSQSFPIHFGELKNLRHLDLSGCTTLTELPNSLSELLHLQYLALQYCINLSIPSDILGEISTLEYVDFKGCAKLVHLPEGMANQRSLKYLNLEFCFELKTMTDLSNFVHLRFLNINGCVKLETANLEGLRSL